MTQPIRTDYYVQAGAWTTKRADNEQFGNAGITLGGTLKTNSGLYVNGELGVGTALRGQVTAGKDTHIDNGFGIDVSARAACNQQLLTSNKVEINQTIFSDNGINTNNFTRKYKSTEIKFAGRAEAVKKLPVGQIRAGIEAGYQNDLSDKPVSLSTHYNENVGLFLESNYEPRSKGFYITPTVGGQVNLTKSGDLKLVANMSLNEATAGIKYTF